MIYITGDTHSDFRRFTMSTFPEQKEMTKDDYVIICGDFGGVWYQENSNETHKGSGLFLQRRNIKGRNAHDDRQIRCGAV